MSSAESSKAQIFKKFIKHNFPDTKLIIPNIADKFSEAIPQLNKLVSEDLSESKSFIGSSLGGFFATYFAELYEQKAIVINPAINPSEGLKEYLGTNKNYSNGNKFTITKNDINFIRSLSYKKILKPKNLMILLESGDEILNYSDTSSYFSGSHIDVLYGGDHSYSSFKEKFSKIQNFLKIT